MLGAVADDFIGATDLAIMLRRNGHRVAVVIEENEPDPAVREGLDAVVVALKSRTAPVEQAVATSGRAVDRLRDWGAETIYVKYCSTFDSTDRGNIGPVLDTVADRMGADTVVVAPALPANGRTVYQGHLFVGSDLLEHSSMADHPLTPMRRSRVRELLAPQTPHAVGEIHLATVRRGPGAVAAALAAATERYVVVDTTDDDDLAVLGAAVAGAPVLSGGSGLALGLPDPGAPADDWRPAPAGGVRLTLCGSASAATRRQVAEAARTAAVLRVDPHGAIRQPQDEIARITTWVREQPAEAPAVVYATAEPGDVVAEIDGAPVAPAVEAVLAGAGTELVADGTVTRLLVAGGETSGAVVRALGAGVLRVGPEITPGVCWTTAATAAGPEVSLALKSGNFGTDDLFTSAWDVLA